MEEVGSKQIYGDETMKGFGPGTISESRGFTLVELLVYTAIVGVVTAAIFTTFKSQQDSYLVQEEVAAMQQNLRAAMYILANDIQMCGYYTSFDGSSYSMDWDPTSGGNESIRPLIYGRNNDNDADDGADNGVRNGTDLIVVVKAGEVRKPLTAGEGGTEGTSQITLNDLDLDGDGNNDFKTTSRQYGVITKADLSRSEFFKVDSINGTTLTVSTASGSLTESYTTDDLIARADVIIYKVNDDSSIPCLERRNLGNDSGYQAVAENITDLQFRYRLNDDTWVDDPSGSEEDVREIRISLVSDVQISAAAGSKERRLCSLVKARNIGLD